MEIDFNKLAARPQSSKILHVQLMIYPNVPCHNCTHLHDKHQFIYSLLNGVERHDRFVCQYPGCGCGFGFQKAYERYRKNISDMNKADAEAHVINAEKYADL